MSKPKGKFVFVRIFTDADSYKEWRACWAAHRTALSVRVYRRTVSADGISLQVWVAVARKRPGEG